MVASMPPAPSAASQSVTTNPWKLYIPFSSWVMSCMFDVMLAPFQRASLTMMQPRPAWIAGRYGAIPYFSIVGRSISTFPRSTTPPFDDVPAVAWPSPAQCLAHAMMPGDPVPRPPMPCRPCTAASAISLAHVGSSL